MFRRVLFRSVITLDRDTLVKAGDRLVINLPGGRAEGRTVESVNGRDVTVTIAYSEAPAEQLQWAIDADDLAIPLYRVMRTARTPEGDYDISALQYEPSKFSSIDTGARLEERPISVVPITVVPAPANVTLTSSYAVNQGIAISTMNISWPAVTGAVAYDVEWRKDSGNWIKVQRTGSTSVDVTGIYSGAYVARVRSVSAFEISSIWKSSNLTNLEGKVGLPPAVAFLTTSSELFGIGIKWGFPAGAEDTQRTELWYGPANDLAAATKLADLAYPQADYRMQSLLAGASFFFWVRLVDRTGNVGPLYPVGSGVMGMASADAAPVLELIAGQIGRTELGKDILDEIDKIPSLQAQIDALDGLSAYDPEQTYLEGDLVVVGKRIYQATGLVPVDTPPPNANFWQDVGQAVVTANGLARQVEINTASITELDGVVTANASSLQALQSAYRDDTGEGDLQDALQGYSAAASFAQEVKTQASKNSAMVQRQSELAASVSDVSGSVTDLESVVVTDREATARAIQQVSVEVGETSAAVQTVSQAQADTDGKLSTMWSVKMQVNSNGQYVAAGIGLGIEQNADGLLQSQFLVSADRFAVVNTLAGGTVTTPFVVQGGQVFMNSAFIQDASIGVAKLTQSIQSANYVPGKTGLMINFVTGEFELNSTVGVGGRQTINNRGGKVYDENDTKRYQWGDLSA